MHMRQLGKEVLYSVPIPVYFAGFESDTQRLGRQGWELSMRQEMGFRGYELQMAGRIGGENGLYFLTRPLAVEYPHGTNLEIARRFAQTGFEVQHLAPEIRARILPHAGGIDWARSFSPVDTQIQERFEDIDIRTFKYFKVVDQKKDLIVRPENVPELLDMILKIQAPEQEVLRARERSRENYEAYRSGNMFSEPKPAHQVEAQIISLAI